MFKRCFVLFFLSIAYPLLSFGEENAVGVGWGALYNGAGVNYRTKNDNYFNYYSVGCRTIGYGESSGFIANCGIGYSLLMTKFVKGNHHGVFGNIGVSYANYATISGITYATGVSYAYFFNGADGEGWNIQVGPIYEYFDDRIYLAGLFGAGYQY